jgi:predicted acylesterase/phospholipase RssA/CRP-like cAMP-binding protein
VTVARPAPAAKVASVMRASPYLRGLEPAHLRLLGRAAESVAVAAGASLETGGEPRLYLVLSGEVGTWTPEDPDGFSELVGQEGPGGMFGSTEITGETEPHVYRAATAVEVLVWRTADLRRVYAQAPGLERRLAVRLSRRRREDELVALLRRTPLFGDAGQALVRWVVRSATLDRFEAGNAICREGDAGDAMFLIVAGEIAICREAGDAPQAEPRTLARLHRGDFFGELALVARSPRTASAVALAGAEILVVSKATVEILDERSPAFRDAVRLTAQRRLEVIVGGAPAREPELVWLVVDDRRVPAAGLASLLAEALAETGGDVVEPAAMEGGASVRAALAGARQHDADHALLYSDGAVPDRLARLVAERAASVVVVDGDGAAPFAKLRGAFHRVHHVVLSPPDAVRPQPARRDALVLHARPGDLRKPALDRVPGVARGDLRRIARAVGRRRVGLALGGGAAWGYAHVALVRALHDAGIPIDLIVGVSMGSVVGAFYASRGLDGLDRLVDAHLELAAAALGAVATTQAVNLFVRRHVPQARLEELALPLATVAVDARTAREKVFRHGSIAAAVRASCSLPGVFAPSILGGHRYLDGAVRHNVPASHCIDAGADFVIACDVVPLPGVPRNRHGRGLTGRVFDLTQVNRLSDAVRSLYWLTSDSGQRQASVADVVFSPDLAGFDPWDFPRAHAIVARAETQLADWLPATVARYGAVARVATR